MSGRLDTKVLTGARPEHRPIVYKYRTGVFLSRMKRHIAASAKASGQLVQWLSPPELGNHIAVPSLLGAKPLAAVELGERGRITRLMVDTFAEQPPLIAALFVDEKNKDCDSEAFASILENSDLVIETPFDRTHIGDILNFLQARSGMTVHGELTDRPDVIEHFASLAETTDGWTVVSVFDSMLAAIDDAKSEIDFEVYESPVEVQRPALIPVIVGENTGTTEDFMFSVLKSLRLGVPREQLVREICNTVAAQLKLSVERLAVFPGASQSRSTNTLRLVKFTLQVLGWLEALSIRSMWREPFMGPDEFVWSLYRLVSKAADQHSTLRQSVPDAQLGIERRDSSGFLAYHFERVAAHLKSTLNGLIRVTGSGWAADLNESLFPADAVISSSRGMFPAGAPTQQLLDLGRAGEKLSRLPAYELSKPTVILHGTDEQALGRLSRAYAKSILCETGSMNSWCGTCPSCLQFEVSTLLGRIEPVDLGQSDAKAKVQTLVDVLRAPTLADRIVVTLLRAEAGGPVILDSLLKTLEDPPKRVSFILVSSDLSVLTPAIRSRAYALKGSAHHASRGDSLSEPFER